jgi:hypothetical protein
MMETDIANPLNDNLEPVAGVDECFVDDNNDNSSGSNGISAGADFKSPYWRMLGKDDRRHSLTQLERISEVQQLVKPHTVSDIVSNYRGSSVAQPECVFREQIQLQIKRRIMKEETLSQELLASTPPQRQYLQSSLQPSGFAPPSLEAAMQSICSPDEKVLALVEWSTAMKSYNQKVSAARATEFLTDCGVTERSVGPKAYREWTSVFPDILEDEKESNPPDVVAERGSNNVVAKKFIGDSEADVDDKENVVNSARKQRNASGSQSGRAPLGGVPPRTARKDVAPAMTPAGNTFVSPSAGSMDVWRDVYTNEIQRGVPSSGTGPNLLAQTPVVRRISDCSPLPAFVLATPDTIPPQTAVVPATPNYYQTHNTGVNPAAMQSPISSMMSPASVHYISDDSNITALNFTVSPVPPPASTLRDENDHDFGCRALTMSKENEPSAAASAVALAQAGDSAGPAATPTPKTWTLFPSLRSKSPSTSAASPAKDEQEIENYESFTSFSSTKTKSNSIGTAVWRAFAYVFLCGALVPAPRQPQSPAQQKVAEHLYGTGGRPIVSTDRPNDLNYPLLLDDAEPESKDNHADPDC